jgi:ABC-2 type transport system permease protein
MRGVLAICKRELLSFFVSPVAYFVVTGFTLLAGYFFFQYLSFYNRVLASAPMLNFQPGQVPNLNEFVIQNFFLTLVVILVFTIPLLTMRIMAEEKRRGTFELLLTSPLSVTEIVLGKFLGLAAVILIMLGLAGAFPFWLILYSNPEALPVLSGFVGVVLCTLAFASIGMACSSFTENQIVAGISSMVALLFLYVVQSSAEGLTGVTADVLRYLSPMLQVSELVKGVISLKSLAYFASLIVLGLFISQRAVEARRWR